MTYLSLGKIDIVQIDVTESKLKAQVLMEDNGVFMVLLSSRSGDIIHKRFVQFEGGENHLQLPIHDLKRGQYILSLLKGNHTARRYFSH